MADKFCVPGLATGLNDGTSWANAWQNLEQVVENTIASGSYATGDNIYVATNDGSADTAVSDNATWIFAAITGGEANPVNLIFDDGTKSDGSTTMPAGTFTKTQTGDTTALSLTTSWNIYGNNRFDLKTNRSANHNILLGSGYMQDFDIYLENTIQQQGISASSTSGKARGLLTLSNVTIYPTGSQNGSRSLFRTARGSTLRMFNVWVDFTNHSTTIANTSYWIFGVTDAVNGLARIEAFGGGVKNATTTFNLVRPFQNDTQSYGGNITLDNFSLPAIMNSVAAGFLKAPEPETSVFASGDQTFAMRGGVDPEDMVYASTNGWAQVEESGNYPTLSAKLPDSASGTSYSMKIYTGNLAAVAATTANPFKCPVVKKDYDQTAAAKTITVEVLIDSRQSPTDHELWFDVMYTDNATGNTVIESTRTMKKDEAALTTSTASWTSTTYATQSYNKRKISLTTANSIKQYTEITVIMYSGFACYDSNSFWFYDPDFSIT